MSLTRLFGLVACAMLMGWGNVLAGQAGGADVLKEHGLSKSGSIYILAEESQVLEGMKALRATKADADKEVKARTLLNVQIAAKRKVVKDSQKTWEEMDARLPTIQRPADKNSAITRMNRLVSDQKLAAIAVKDLEAKADKLSDSAQVKYVDDLTELNTKASAAIAKYVELAASAEVKAAMLKANNVATSKVVLGPSTEFTSAAEELKKSLAAIDSESIPLREHNGIYLADVLLNGEKFQMSVATSASNVILPGEVAEKLKLVPGPQNPTIQMTMANGATIQGKEMFLKTVRVGRFTMENVECVVLEKGLPNPPLLLGNSFLSHFIVKMDASKQELHLTEVKPSSPSTPSKPVSTGSGSKL